MELLICLLLSLLIFSVSSAAADSSHNTRVVPCDSCVHQTKAAYFAKSTGLSGGACGYGSMALNMSAGHIAAAIPSLYKDGAGCGACYQVRCKNTTLCAKGGTQLIVTDLNMSNKTDFVMSSRAFRAMANKGMDKYILGLGIVDVEYKRITCPYKKNLAIRVEEMSKKPHYLAIKFSNMGGQTEIGAVDVISDGGSTTAVFHNYGAVYATSNVPKGQLLFRLTMYQGADRTTLTTTKPIPANWKPGMIYDTGVKVTAIKWEFCSTCAGKTW